MRRFILLLFAIFLSIMAFAQLEVKKGSFKEVPGFININPDENYQLDDNNLPFAVIKVRTENINEKERKRLSFSGNMGTIINLEYRDGEVWVYLTAQYADYLKISHPDFSSIEFTIPFDLKPMKGYEMTLVNKANAVVSGWAALTVTTKPENGAKVLLNGRDVNAITPYSNNMIPSGKYEITVSKYRFETTTKTVDIQDGENKSVEIEMPFVYGKLFIDTEPSGAAIYIDGNDYGVTPAELNNVVVGNHELRLDKTGCAPLTKTITLDEANKLTISEKLQTGREILISTDGSGDKIFVDGKYIGESPLNVTLSFGEHEITAISGYSGDINNDGRIDALNAIKAINGVKAAAKTITVAPKPQVTQIQVVEDDVEVEDIDINAEVDQDEVIEEYVYEAPEIEEEDIQEAEVFKVVEEMPEFPGGTAKLLEYIQKNMKYPMMARESDIQGKVYVQFVVEPDGSISNVMVLRGIGGGCDEEAVRVVQSMPKFKPGKQRGAPVRVQYMVPIVFKLQ